MEALKALDVPADGNAFDWDAFAARGARDEAVRAAVDSCVSLAAQRARDPDVVRAVVQSAARTCVSRSLDAVDLFFVRRDESESQRAALAAEPEVLHPQPAIDTWARGVLPVKRVASSYGTAHGTGKQTGRASAIRTAGSMSSPVQRSASGRLSMAASMDSGQGGLLTSDRSGDDGPGSDPSAVALTSGDLSAEDVSVPPARIGHGRDSLKTSCLHPIGAYHAQGRKGRKASTAEGKPTAEQIELEQRLRDELEARKAAREVLRQADSKDAKEKAALLALQQELRGKDFGYDHSGQVVVLNRVDPDRLPPTNVHLKFRFQDPRGSFGFPQDSNLGQEPLGGDAVGKGPGALRGRGRDRPGRASGPPSSSKAAVLGSGSPRGSPRGGMANPEATAPEFVKRTANGLPSMMEGMRIARGVTVKEGDLMKAGPRLDAPLPGEGMGGPGGPEQEQRMTRRDYFALRQREGGAGGAGGPMDTLGSGMESIRSGGDWGEATFGSGLLQMMQSVEDPLLVGAKVRGPPAGAAGGEEAGDAGANGAGSNGEREDVNLVLISAEDWGQNSPPAKVNLPRQPAKPFATNTLGRSPRRG